MIRRKARSTAEQRRAQEAAGRRRGAREARRARRVAEEAGSTGVALTAWEGRFLDDPQDGVAGRLERYGRAFGQPGLAAPDDPQGPLSTRQRAKLREVERKVRQAARAGTGGGEEGG